MKKIVQNLKNGKTELIEIPKPNINKNQILIRTTHSLVSLGTERMLVDFAKSKDIHNYECVSEKGAKVFVEPKATMYLLGSTMDYHTDKLSSRFVFKNPNEKNTCGCGESFSI